MSVIKPKRLSWTEIREKAEKFRKKYVNPLDMVPVPVEEILEFDLEITPWPIDNLLQKADIDGFISNDLKHIFVDKNIYLDSRFANRLRFTFAHEAGHFVLHKEEIQQYEFRTENDWIHFREEMSEEDLFWFEQQAYEFAGRLLVPKSKLIQELENNRGKVNQFRDLVVNSDDEMLKQAISRVICDTFGVSDSVILKRIRNEKIWNELNF